MNLCSAGKFCKSERASWAEVKNELISLLRQIKAVFIFEKEKKYVAYIL